MDILQTFLVFMWSVHNSGFRTFGFKSSPCLGRTRTSNTNTERWSTTASFPARNTTTCFRLGNNAVADDCCAGSHLRAIILQSVWFFDALGDKCNGCAGFVQQQLTVGYRSQDSKLVTDKFYYVKSHG